MKKLILKLLKKFIDWLSTQHEKNRPKEENKLPYHWLSPTDEAEETDDYLEALRWALDNRSKIKNVAIAGPYGSGKSSVIKTFQKKHKSNNEYKFLNISLATFKEDKEKNKDEMLRLIELSIMQQFFYHEKDDKIPDSRFKKIKIDKYICSVFKTVALLVFVMAFIYFVFPSFLAKFYLLKILPRNSKIFNYTLVAIVISYICFIMYKSIKALRGFTIKKLGISSASIEIDHKISRSILNNHIDEILYFFEVTEHNIVIIEDIDRFNQTDIFTKLREINLLINSSKKIEKDVIFVYAIRDDMFKDKDRTKFFDFIIPVIPIINYSNSNEKILELLKDNRHNISNDLIDDISLFIDDMRLLYNIMNEYHIYSKKLDEKLDEGKLLSMVVYKNIYPNDFTKLSQNEGDIYKVINLNKNEYLSKKANEIDKKIKEKEDEITKYENVKLNDIKELRIIYLYKIIENINETDGNYPFFSFWINSKAVDMSEATKDDNFRSIISAENFVYAYNDQGYTQNYTFNFSSIEEEINHELTYEKREALIISKQDIEKLKNPIEKLKEKKDEIRKYKLKDLISNGLIGIESENKSQNQLINILLRNGYIDEDYLDYISIFYEGTLSKNDYQFLMNVKTQKDNEFDYPLQKKENLLKKINEFEFDKKYILNYSLSDFLIESPNFSDKRKRYFAQLSNKSDAVIEFIDGYVDRAINIEKFIKFLCKDWVKIWDFIANKPSYTEERRERYFELIIKHAEIEDIKKIFIDSREKISDNKDFLLIIKKTDKLKRIIQELDIKFTALNEASPEELLDYVYDNNYYSLNIQTIKFFLKIKERLIENDFETKNYSAIKESKLVKMIDYIESNMNDYISLVYLKIKTNVEETETLYIELLDNENISYANKVKIVAQIETIITNINDIKNMEIVKLLLKKSKISVTWKNFIDIYEKSGGKFIEEMVTFLNIEENAIKFSKIKINKEILDEETIKSFLGELLLNDDIEDISYSHILSSVPYIYNSLNFESLSFEKVKLLIGKNILVVNSVNYELLKNNFKNLHILLIEKDPEKFIEKIGSFQIENEDLLKLLESDEILTGIKERIIESFDVSKFTQDSKLLTQIGKLLLGKSSLDIDKLIIKSIGTDSSLTASDKIELYNKYKDEYNNEDIDNFLGSMEKPYSEISINGKRPSIENNKINEELVKNLKLKGHIPGYAINKIKIIIHTFKKHKK